MTRRPQRILVTGAAGFVGGHLIDYLRKRGGSVLWGLVHRDIPPASDPRYRGVRLVQSDLRDTKNMRDHLRRIRPDWVFHLAGQAVVSRSWKYPETTLDLNIQGQLHLFEGLRALNLKPRILSSCSSDEYGDVQKKDLPVTENSPLRPLSPYAVSKVGEDLMAYQYFRSYGFQVIRTRAFNHTGPGHPDSFAVPSFAKQIAEVEAGLREPFLHTGNLQARRDYLDVRDVVRAYVLALEEGTPGEVYNVCSGRVWSMRQILDLLLTFTPTSIKIVPDRERMRPSDIPVIYGDSGKFRRLTGWRPQIPFQQTLRDTLDFWRDKMHTSPHGN